MGELIQCRVCGEKVSVNARFCRGCGEPNFIAAPIVHETSGGSGCWIIFGLILFVAAVAAVGQLLIDKFVK